MSRVLAGVSGIRRGVVLSAGLVMAGGLAVFAGIVFAAGVAASIAVAERNPQARARPSVVVCHRTGWDWVRMLVNRPT